MSTPARAGAALPDTGRRNASRLLVLGAVALLSMAASTVGAAPQRIGFLSPSTVETSAVWLAALRQGLRENGFLVGTDIVIEARYADNQLDRLPALARELLDLQVRVLVTFVTQATVAAKDATQTVPIVMVGVSDPVSSGLVTSLSRPGGNVTGTSAMLSESAGKRLQLLQEAAPHSRRVAVLWNPANPTFQRQAIADSEVAARQLGIEVKLFEAGDPAAIDRAFAAIAKERFTALNVLPDPTIAAHGARIASLATSLRLPSISANSAFAEAGGMMTYGPSFTEFARAAAVHVAKILRGAKPSELAVLRPTKFELVINLKTARAIGVAIPRSLQVRADRMIE